MPWLPHRAGLGAGVPRWASTRDHSPGACPVPGPGPHDLPRSLFSPTRPCATRLPATALPQLPRPTGAQAQPFPRRILPAAKAALNPHGAVCHLVSPLGLRSHAVALQ